MEKFVSLRNDNASSRYREQVYSEGLYEDFAPRFTNAWTTADADEIQSEYATFGDEEEVTNTISSVYEDMTFDPISTAGAGDDGEDPIRRAHEDSKRQSLTRSAERPRSGEFTSTPPLYRALMNRLSVSGGADKKTKSLPRNAASPLRSSKVISRQYSLKTVNSNEVVSIPIADQNVMNPLFTPSPGASPCGSPRTYNSLLSDRLKNDNCTDDDDIYDSPRNFPDKPPVLPPKKKSLSLKLQNKVGLERSISLDSQRQPNPDKQKGRRRRQISLGDKSSKNVVCLASVESPAISSDEDEYVGALIEKSAKSDKLEKRLSHKSKKERMKEVKTGAQQDAETEETWARHCSLAQRDDWDEIDSMMLELQCDISHTQQTIRRPTAQSTDRSLEIWLKSLEIQEIQTMMELNGWDHVKYLHGTMSKEDLVTMGIHNEKIKRKLLKSVEENLVNFKHDTMPETVEEWLTSIDLQRYLNRFISNRMGSMTRVLEIWEVELTSILNIEPIGHRKRIMKSIRDLRTRQKSLDSEEKKKKTAPSSTPKWFHTSEELLRGVDYPARYFGCAKIDGPENTKQSSAICHKLQGKIKDGQKVPEYRLRISAEGIEFIDKQTQRPTCKYRIEDISFVSRDKTDLLVFSFISSDRKLNIKMCHVFKAHSRQQAFETCTTIAQSFEVAYQVREEKKKLGVS